MVGTTGVHVEDFVMLKLACQQIRVKGGIDSSFIELKGASTIKGGYLLVDSSVL